MNLQYVAVINDSQIVSHPPGESLLTADHVVFDYTEGSVIRCQASIILLGEGGKEKA